MSTLPKYARRYYDSMISYLSSFYKVSRKDLLHKIESCSISDLQKYLLFRYRGNNSDISSKFISKAYASFDTISNLNNGMHFCVNEFPKETTYNAFSSNDIDSSRDLYIDFSYRGRDYFLHAWKRKHELEVKNVGSYKYNVMLYADYPEMQNYNKEELCGQYGNIWKYLEVCKLHITADGKSDLTEISHGNKYIYDNYDTEELFTTNYEMFFSPVNAEKMCNDLELPTSAEIRNLINHVMYCYKNRSSLTRKNGRARKSYENCKIHVVVNEREVDDKYISLAVYNSNTRERKEPKGGHHASPVEHDRRGFYRKSRGRGDYDLIDGQYVYVGDMKGRYSKVAPTHVGGIKKKIHKIYKT